MSSVRLPMGLLLSRCAMYKSVEHRRHFNHYENMKSSQALTAFAALAQETRLGILRLLIRVGADGLPAGEIAAKMGVPAPTLSFHIASLQRAGLVTSLRVQRQIIYAPNYEGVRALLSFLLEDCCNGHPEICAGLFATAEPGCGTPCAPVPKKAQRRAAKG